jgi:hypothetical protein
MDVAIKVLEGIEWDESVKSDFIAEVNVMVQLVNPHIVLCMGACIEEEDGDNHYAIILEYMHRGNLHNLIHDKKVLMPLSRQLQCAVDICKGMAWLSARHILHRDLKPANILVDANWTCKICDFGLSQIQKTKQKLQDDDEAAGSVLWMAPEVLLKQQFDSKLDVYSFALVLWELFTRKELFPEYDSKDTFTEAIARQNIRPPLDGIHPVLQKIISQSWDRDPQKRPTFEELLILLQNAWGQIFIPATCPLAIQFWEKYFKGKWKVDWDLFVRRFPAALGKKKDSSKLKLNFECLDKLATEEEKGEKFITIERFGTLLKWFGPIKSEGADILDHIQNTMKQDWFFGPIAYEDAEGFLKHHKLPGTFLVRLNMGGSTPVESSPFTISRVDEKGKILHSRITRIPGGLKIQTGKDNSLFTFSQNSYRLETFITQLKQKQPSQFRESCPGWPFQQLFVTSLTSGDQPVCIYEGLESEKEDDTSDNS